MNAQIKLIVLFLSIASVFSSCSDDRLDVDVSEVSVPEIKILRLDRDFFQFNAQNYTSKTNELKGKYGTFYDNYTNQILNPGDVNESVEKAVLSFVANNDMKMMHNDVQKIYTDDEIQQIGNELNLGLKHFKYHFPEKHVPLKIITFESGFNYNIITEDSILGIGLEMYLGDKNKFYEMLQWPKYKVSQLSKEYIVTDAMKGWIVQNFDTNEPMNNLLGFMVFYGKLLYCLDAVLPKTADSLKIGYSTKQIDYCNKFEHKIWAYFTEKDRLYKNDMKLVNEYITEGPFTSAISKECPPRIAMWVGWQLVRNYMNKNKKVTLAELMDEDDYQKILNLSKYKP
jgi:hypothetical protein